MIETDTLARPRSRRLATIVATLAMSSSMAACHAENTTAPAPESTVSVSGEALKVPTSEVVQKLGEIAIKGRAPKTGYSRDQFGEGWRKVHGCSTRNIILRRDLTDVTLAENGCTVVAGSLVDPYVGGEPETKISDIDIDHVVALSDAWQKGAQQLDRKTRINLANDTLNLQAVKDDTNVKKSDRDISGWRPQKSEQCRLVARQILVKDKYKLWVTQPEHDTMQEILNACPGQVFAIPK